MNKLRQLVSLCFCILAFANTYAQDLEYLWAKKSGGSYTEEGNSVTTDAYGNVIVTGTFTSSSITFGDITLTKADSTAWSMFVVKYDPDGNPLWAKRAVTPSEYFTTTGNSVTTDSDGNIYVAGDLWGDTVTFDAQTYVLPEPYGQASFFAKYDSDGDFQGAKMALNGRGTMGIAIDGAGEIYITGITNNLIEFDGYVYTTGAGGVFLAKYSDSGDFIWADLTSVSISSYGFNSEWMSYGVCTDNDNSVYITGWCGTDTIFFNSEKTVYVVNNQSLRNVFIANYELNENALLAKGASRTIRPGITYVIYGYCVKASGNFIYLAGIVTGDSVCFENNRIYTFNNYQDMFITKYDQSGNNIWAKSIGSNSVDWGNSLAMDSSGDIYLAGITNGGEIHLNTIPIDTIIGGNNAMIFKFDPDGDFLLFKNPLNIAGGQSAGNGITIDADDNIFITGSYYGSVSFGADTLHPDGIWEDVFLAKAIKGSLVSIDQTEPLSEQMVLYPNPANTFIQVEIKEPHCSDIEIRIFNLTGSLVITKKTNDSKSRINVADLCNGIYLLEIRSGNFCKKQKFVIHR